MSREEILNLGKILRQKRKEKSLTLRQVSKEARISIGLLSLIENGVTNPSIGTLLKIAEVLETPISSFFSNLDSNKGIYVLRNDQRKRLKTNKNKWNAHYSYEYLAHDEKSTSIQPFLVTFDTENNMKKPRLYSHKGEEFLYVFEGKVEFVTKDETIVLEKGDSIHFMASIPHTFRRKGEREPKCITIVHDGKND
jgi:transcriptional regulator with XRE-family HTH domain